MISYKLKQSPIKLRNLLNVDALNQNAWQNIVNVFQGEYLVLNYVSVLDAKI